MEIYFLQTKIRMSLSKKTATSLPRVESFTFQFKSNSLLQNYQPILSMDIDYEQVEAIIKSKNIDSIRFMACGNNSLIFVGIHKRSQKLISIKVLLKDDIEKLSGSIIKRNLPYEKLYTNDKICKVYELFSDAGLFYILSDHHKDNLARVLMNNNGPIKEYIVRDIFRSVLNALNHIHLQKIAHRNLKLENILLNENFQPVLADYSYTIIIEELKNYDKLMETSIKYLAPEILSRLPYDPMIADIWSLGVCFYVLLFNFFPYQPYVEQTPKSVKFKESGQVISGSGKCCIRSMLEHDIIKRANTTSLLQCSWIQEKMFS